MALNNNFASPGKETWGVLVWNGTNSVVEEFDTRKEACDYAASLVANADRAREFAHIYKMVYENSYDREPITYKARFI